MSVVDVVDQSAVDKALAELWRYIQYSSARKILQRLVDFQAQHGTAPLFRTRTVVGASSFAWRRKRAKDTFSPHERALVRFVLSLRAPPHSFWNQRNVAVAANAVSVLSVIAHPVPMLLAREYDLVFELARNGLHNAIWSGASTTATKHLQLHSRYLHEMCADDALLCISHMSGSFRVSIILEELQPERFALYAQLYAMAFESTGVDVILNVHFAQALCCCAQTEPALLDGIVRYHHNLVDDLFRAQRLAVARAQFLVDAEVKIQRQMARWRLQIYAENEEMYREWARLHEQFGFTDGSTMLFNQQVSVTRNSPTSLATLEDNVRIQHAQQARYIALLKHSVWWHATRIAACRFGSDLEMTAVVRVMAPAGVVRHIGAFAFHRICTLIYNASRRRFNNEENTHKNG